MLSADVPFLQGGERTAIALGTLTNPDFPFELLGAEDDNRLVVNGRYVVPDTAQAGATNVVQLGEPVQLADVQTTVTGATYLSDRPEAPPGFAFYLVDFQIQNTGLIDSISLIGVTLLLFLAGLVLHPDRLIRLFKSVTLVVFVISAVSWLMVFGVLQAFGFSRMDSTIAGLALMFSSTILVVKLLPTTALHQQHMGSLCIAILIAQDILAVMVMAWFTRPKTA